MLNYAQRVRIAAQQLDVRDLVILMECVDASQSVCGSGNLPIRCLDAQTLLPCTDRLPEPDGLKRLLRHSALAQYISGQLKFRPSVFLAAIFSRNAPAEPWKRAFGAVELGQVEPNVIDAVSAHLVNAVMTNFFAEVRRYVLGRLLLVVDGRRTSGLEISDVDVERAHLIQRLRERDQQVIDLEPIYFAHAQRSRLSLQVGPYDGHLNALGVGLVMKEVAARLAR